VTDEMLARLRTVPILADVPEDEVRCLYGGTERTLAAGDYLAHQGDPPHFFWFLLTGELRILHVAPDGSVEHVATAPAGTALGEMALLSNIPYGAGYRASEACEVLEFDEQQFWRLMTDCPSVRKAVLGNMAQRFLKYQSAIVQQEKMASLGTLAAGLMHELNNPGAAAVRAAAQLRENLMRMHKLTAKFSKAHLSDEQKQCMFDLQEQALSKDKAQPMNSLEQSDAEEALAEWMESSSVENAWKLAPTLVSIGITQSELECAREEFPGPVLSDALNWLEALVSSIQLVGTIEESIGRVATLVKAVKSYAYEGKGQKQSVDINESIHATLIILAHKFREKQITLEKSFGQDLPPLQCECSGLNQIWTNLLDNAIDAVPQGGTVRIRTWMDEISEAAAAGSAGATKKTDPRRFLCVTIADNGAGIPLESQPHVFDPFYTTKPVGVGTGLGLGIVQRIVDQYEGAITFSSEPGATEFRVRLPLDRS
jgi:signal transduction histidine kinase